MPSAEDLGELVNLDAVRKSIGPPVTEEQKKIIMEDLELAVEDFIEREMESSAASNTIPFVTVNSRTNIVAIHSRLLFALQLSVEKSVERLGIPMDSGAFDKVTVGSKLVIKVYFLSVSKSRG